MNKKLLWHVLMPILVSDCNNHNNFFAGWYILINHNTDPFHHIVTLMSQHQAPKWNKQVFMLQSRIKIKDNFWLLSVLQLYWKQVTWSNTSYSLTYRPNRDLLYKQLCESCEMKPGALLWSLSPIFSLPLLSRSSLTGAHAFGLRDRHHKSPFSLVPPSFVCVFGKEINCLSMKAIHYVSDT